MGCSVVYEWDKNIGWVGWSATPLLFAARLRCCGRSGRALLIEYRALLGGALVWKYKCLFTTHTRAHTHIHILIHTHTHTLTPTLTPTRKRSNLTHTLSFLIVFPRCFLFVVSVSWERIYRGARAWSKDEIGWRARCLRESDSHCFFFVLFFSPPFWGVDIQGRWKTK